MAAATALAAVSRAVLKSRRMDALCPGDNTNCCSGRQPAHLVGGMHSYVSTSLPGKASLAQYVLSRSARPCRACG